MTTNKAQKRAVRARMAKTGERYTTARHYELDLHRAPADTPPPAIEAPTLPPRAAEPGLSDATIQSRTGKTWDEWFAVLDAWQATSKSHTEIARHISVDLGVDGWWAQSVTVGYERARGMRAVNQNSQGFSANTSRTLPVPIERLYAVVVESPATELRVRRATPHKSARFDVGDTGTILVVMFTPRGADKSTVTLTHGGLADAAAVQTWRAHWKAYLDDLTSRLRGDAAK